MHKLEAGTSTDTSRQSLPSMTSTLAAQVPRNRQHHQDGCTDWYSGTLLRRPLCRLPVVHMNLSRHPTLHPPPWPSLPPNSLLKTAGSSSCALLMPPNTSASAPPAAPGRPPTAAHCPASQAPKSVSTFAWAPHHDPPRRPLPSPSTTPV